MADVHRGCIGERHSPQSPEEWPGTHQTSQGHSTTSADALRGGRPGALPVLLEVQAALPLRGARTLTSPPVCLPKLEDVQWLDIFTQTRNFSGSSLEALKVGDVGQSLADCFAKCEGCCVCQCGSTTLQNCDYSCYVVIIDQHTHSSMIVLCDSWRLPMRSFVLLTTSVFTLDGGKTPEPEPK